MAPKRNTKVNNLDYSKLIINDVLCPLCRSILIKPITLPCHHGFCDSCFEAKTDNANCPVCSVRVGSWLRSAKRSNKLVNETLWKAIQVTFPLEVKRKLIKCENRHQSCTPNVPVLKLNEETIAKYEQNNKSLNSSSNEVIKKHEKTTNKIPIINLATKEYTCRILCQNVNSRSAVASTSNESLFKKNKQIQKLTESDKLDNRSNSIESECLYFKPIDYRNNPRSEGLAPVKIPTKKPSLNRDFKIVAPCGQIPLSISNLQSAFAKLNSSVSPVITYKAREIQIIDAEESQTGTIPSLKRKGDKLEVKSKKKTRNTRKSTLEQIQSSGESNSPPFHGFANANANHSNNNIHSNFSKATNMIKKLSQDLLKEEKIKKALQEQSDYEMARQLQQQFNQAAKYLTRSTVPKRTSTNQQVKLGRITHKVK